MSTRRTTFDKRQRERDKQAKAAGKRARRQERANGESDDVLDTTDNDDDATTEQLLARLEALHADYDEGKVSFDDFDEQKSSLMDRIAIKLAQ